MAQQSVVHVINGSAAAGTLRQVLSLTPAEDLLISHDLYSCGPLPPIDSPADWRRSRELWWTDLLTRQGIQMRPDYLGWPGELLDNLDALETCKSIILWIGTGLADQVLLVFLVHLLRRISISPSRLQVIQYDRVDTGSLGVVISTGELNEDQLRSHPKPLSLGDRELDTIDAAWMVFTSSEPSALSSFASGHDGGLPFLRHASQALLRRYPDYRYGLGIWDRAALECTLENGPKAVRVVAAMMTHDLEQPDWPGDSYLYSYIQRLGAVELAHPLLSLSEPNKPMRETAVAITKGGRAVLNGEANAVALNGIDDWIAGVHLDSKAGRVWFHRDGELVPAG